MIWLAQLIKNRRIQTKWFHKVVKKKLNRIIKLKVIDLTEDSFETSDEAFETIVRQNEEEAEIRQLQSEFEGLPARSPDTIIEAGLSPYLLRTLEEELQRSPLARDGQLFIDETAAMRDNEPDPPAATTPEYTQL